MFQRCWKYSVQWQKKRITTSHIRVWLYDEITTNEIDDLLHVVVHDTDVVNDIHDVSALNMMHGPSVYQLKIHYACDAEGI